MKRKISATTTALCVVLVVVALAMAQTGHSSDRAVYLMSNDPSGNEILVYDRDEDGTLILDGSYPTGGLGTGGGLGNQGGLVLSDNGRWLLASPRNSQQTLRTHRGPR